MNTCKDYIFKSKYKAVELMTYSEYLDCIWECLEHSLKGYDSKYIQKCFDLYKPDFPHFYKEKWMPETACAAIVYGY